MTIKATLVRGNQMIPLIQVRNLGPDVVPKANVIIQWPFEAVSGKHLLYLIGVEVKQHIPIINVSTS